MRGHRIDLLQHRPVLAHQRAILEFGFQLRGVRIEVQHQSSVMKASAAGDFFLISIEEPTLNVRSVSGDLQPERNVLAIEGDGGVPQARQRLSHGGGRDGEQESS